MLDSGFSKKVPFQSSITTTNLLCNICNSVNRLASKFCRNCGGKISRGALITEEDKKRILGDFNFNRSVGNISEEEVLSPFITQELDDDDDLVPESSDFDEIDEIFLEPSDTFFSEFDEHHKIIDSGKYVIRSLSFLEKLKNTYNMNLDELEILLNYQKYLFETSDRGIALIEEDSGKIISLNSRFEDLTGFSSIDFQGKSFLSLIGKMNSQNKKFNSMKSILRCSKFYIYNKDFEKFSVKVRRNQDLFKSKVLIVFIDSAALAERKSFIKDKSTTKKLFLVAKIAEEINSSLNLNTILNNTMDRVINATRSDAGMIMFIDDNKKLHLMTSKGISDELIENLKSHLFKADSGSRAHALNLGKTVEASMNFKGRERSITGFLVEKEKLNSIVTVPLKSIEETIGIMSLGRRKKKDYTTKELELLDAIANHIVIAVRNSRLYEQVKSQLYTLEEKNSQLRELEQIKKKLTRMIVHDFKNPLTTIMTYSQYLQGRGKDKDERMAKVFRLIYSSCEDLLNMVTNLLNIGKNGRWQNSN